MAKEWTDEEVQAAIGEAVQIVREDRIDKMLSARLKSADTGTNGSTGDNSNSDKNGGTSDKKKSLWWGTED